MARKMINRSLMENCEDYIKFADKFNEKSQERLRYFAATGEKLTFVGMWHIETPFSWTSYVFIAADNETKVFLSIQKTIFLSDKEIGASYVVREKKSKVYVLE